MKQLRAQKWQSKGEKPIECSKVKTKEAKRKRKTMTEMLK